MLGQTTGSDFQWLEELTTEVTEEAGGHEGVNLCEPLSDLCALCGYFSCSQPAWSTRQFSARVPSRQRHEPASLR